MDNTDGKEESEWSEQMGYSEIYFTITKLCRDLQQLNQYQELLLAINNKFSMAKIIINDSECGNIRAVRKGIYDFIKDYSIDVKVNGKSKKQLPEKYHLLYGELLEDFEELIDTAVNKKMPFLKMREKGKITNF